MKYNVLHWAQSVIWYFGPCCMQQHWPAPSHNNSLHCPPAVARRNALVGWSQPNHHHPNQHHHQQHHCLNQHDFHQHQHCWFSSSIWSPSSSTIIIITSWRLSSDFHQHQQQHMITIFINNYHHQGTLIIIRVKIVAWGMMLAPLCIVSWRNILSTLQSNYFGRRALGNQHAIAPDTSWSYIL